MYVPKLSLQNFRIISSASFDWTGTPLIFLRGKKFAGKSSIGQALSMILASTTDGLDAQGRGFEAKIKLGESKAVLAAQILGKHLIERTVTLNTNTSGRTSKSVCIDDTDWHPLPFDNFLARYKDALNVAMNTGYFVNLSEKDQKTLLAKLVLPERYEFPKDKIEAVEKYIGQGAVNFDTDPFSAIELAYKKLFKEREQINRQVRDFVIPEPIERHAIDSSMLQDQLNTAKQERDKLSLAKYDAVKAANAVEVNRAGLQAKLEGLRAEAGKTEAKITHIKLSILPEEQVASLSKVIIQKDELAKLNGKHAQLLASIRATGVQIDRLKEISEQGATCPTCDQSIDGAKIAALIEVLNQERDAADKAIQDTDTKIEAIGDVQGSIDQITKHDAAVKERSDLEASLNETVRIGKATRAEFDALPAKVDVEAPFTQPIADIDATINTLTEQLRPVIAAEERKKDIADKTEQLNKLQAKAKSVDELVNYFGKDGIKAKLIADYIGQFENSIRDVMGICGYKCSLTLEPFDFYVETARGYKGPVKELSGAERHLFSATLQCAVSIASGINVVVIDETQELGNELLALFVPKIYSLIQEGKLEQAILVGYSTDKAIPNPQTPGTAYYFVEDGNVTVLGRRARV